MNPGDSVIRIREFSINSQYKIGTIFIIEDYTNDKQFFYCKENQTIWRCSNFIPLNSILGNVIYENTKVQSSSK